MEKAKQTMNGSSSPQENVNWKEKYEEEHNKVLKLEKKLEFIRQKELEEEKQLPEVLTIEHKKEKEALLKKNQQLEDDLQIVSNQFLSVQQTYSKLKQTEASLLQQINELELRLQAREDLHSKILQQKNLELDAMQTKVDRIIQETMSIVSENQKKNSVNEPTNCSTTQLSVLSGYEKTLQLQISNLNGKIEELTKQKSQLLHQLSTETKRANDLVKENIALRKLIQNPSSSPSFPPSSSFNMTPPPSPSAAKFNNQNFQNNHYSSPSIHQPQSQQPVTYRIRTGGLTVARSQVV